MTDSQDRIHRAQLGKLSFDRVRGLITGYALSWLSKGDHGMWFEAAGWEGNLEVPLIIQRNQSCKVGECKLEADGEGLFATATLAADDVGTAGDLEAGHLDALSADIVVAADGERYRGTGPLSATRWDPISVSLVSTKSLVPRVNADRGPLKLGSKAELVDLLRSTGIARAAAERIAAGGFAALSASVVPSASGVASAVDALIKSLNGERK